MKCSPATGGLRHTDWRALAWATVFLTFVGAWLGFFFTHPDALTKIGVGHYRLEVAPGKFHELWFADTLAVLASNDAVVAGIDPYASNPLDYWQRPHVYGPWWLQLRHLGLTRADTYAVGLTLLTLFVGVTALILRPTSAAMAGWYLAVFCAPPVLAAMERANNDLVVFLLFAVLVPCLLAMSAWLRWLAVPLIAFAAGLKYYPAIAAGILLTGPASSREIRWRLSATFSALIAVGFYVVATVPGFDRVPAPEGMLTFGGTALWQELGVRGLGAQIAVLASGLVALVCWHRSAIFAGWKLPARSPHEWLFFVLGSLLLAGCFFFGTHFGYRLVFAIWLAPFLWRLVRDEESSPSVRRLGRTTAALLLVALWAEPLFVFATHRWPHAEMMAIGRWVHFAMQPFAWGLVICLLGFLAKFLRDGWTALRNRRPADNVRAVARTSVNGVS